MREPEKVHQVGYISEDKQHVLITISNPSVSNTVPRHDCIQVALTIENAIVLRAELNAFLLEHGVLEN